MKQAKNHTYLVFLDFIEEARKADPLDKELSEIGKTIKKDYHFNERIMFNENKISRAENVQKESWKIINKEREQKTKKDKQSIKVTLGAELWTDVYSASDVNMAYENFIKTVKHNLDLTCHFKDCKMINKENIKWRKTIQPIRNEIALIQYCIREGIGEDNKLKNKLKLYKKMLRTEHKQSLRRHYAEKIDEAHNTVQKTWEVIKSFTSKEREINDGIKLLVNGLPCTKPAEVANAFNDYYVEIPENITAGLRKIKFPRHYLRKVNNSIFVRECNEEDVRKIVASLKNKRSAGMDEISNQIIKF